MNFTRAIVCPPGVHFADGLTSADLGQPDYETAIEQHEAYCAALAECDVELIRLPSDDRHPDSTFVEDSAILTPHGAMIARPGAASRAREVDAIGDVLVPWFADIARIAAPGTLDGGDVCQADEHFFIGLSHRTNEAGARQLAAWLAAYGYSASMIDVRAIEGLLHLKSGVTYLGDGRLLVVEPLADHREFARFDRIRVPPEEEYAVNCLAVNGRIIMAQGHDQLRDMLQKLGYSLIELEMSEFRKMDGGLTCMSLRF